MKNKSGIMLTALFICFSAVGVGLGTWVYNSSTDNKTDVNTNINDFKFSTLIIRESDDSASGSLSKIGTTVHNYRCDNKDLGYTNAVIDVCEYFTITSDDDSNLSKAKYKIVSGSGSISGDELTFGDIAGNVVVRCYEEGCEDNYYDLTFTNTITTNTADHDYKTTYGTISWGDWSASATYLTDDTHTRNRTGELPYSTKCTICDHEKESGNLIIDNSNYATYSVYNTDSNTYIKSENCTEDAGNYISQSNYYHDSYTSWVYTDYEKVNETTHKHLKERTEKLYYYTAGWNYFCTSCNHLIRSTGQVKTYKDGDTTSDYDIESHDFTDNKTYEDSALVGSGTLNYYKYTQYNSSYHTAYYTQVGKYTRTYYNTQKCDDCGYTKEKEKYDEKEFEGTIDSSLLQSHSFTTRTESSTCTGTITQYSNRSGYYKYYCSSCSRTGTSSEYGDTCGKAISSSYKCSGKGVKTAHNVTCSGKGVKTLKSGSLSTYYVCTVCGKSGKQGSICGAVTGYTYTQCTGYGVDIGGYDEWRCSVCGAACKGNVRCTATVKNPEYCTGTITKKVTSDTRVYYYPCSSCGADVGSTSTCGRITETTYTYPCSSCGVDVGSTSTCGRTITTTYYCSGTITRKWISTTSYYYQCSKCSRSATYSELGDTCGKTTTETITYCSQCGYTK